MIERCRTLLLEKAAEWDLPLEGRWNFLFYNKYHDLRPSYIVFWFHEGDRQPRMVVKLSRTERILKREFENMAEVYRRCPTVVPRPLHFGPLEEFSMLWMTGVPGQPIAHLSSYPPGALHSVVDMLVSFHRAVRKAEETSPSDRYDRMVSEPLQTVARFAQTSSIREASAMLAGEIPAEWIHSLPVIPQHGDLFCANVFLHGDQPCAVDWEHFGTIDLPFYDLLVLLFSLLRTAGETPVRWNPAVAKQIPVLIQQYAEGLELQASSVPWLLPLTLANWLHLQWADGRKDFRGYWMYENIQDYFEHQNLWHEVFLKRCVLA